MNATTYSRITFIKRFLSGPLAGLEVPCSFDCGSNEVASYRGRLLAKTSENPGADCVTNNLYAVVSVDAVEVC